MFVVVLLMYDLYVLQADSTRAGMKDLDVLLADDSLVLILDDTEHVWEKHRANLIQVRGWVTSG